MKRLPILVATLLAACSANGQGGPSLAPRAAEAIDPRLPVGGGENSAAADAALIAELAAIAADARPAVAAFDAQVPNTQALVAAAGARESEGWIAAQQAVSALEALRAPLAAALTHIDSLAAERITRQGGIAPSDLQAINAARTEIGALNDSRAAIVAAFSAQLGS